MQNSILMSKIIVIKYLPPVRPKLVPKLKMLRIYRNLAHLIFQIADLDFNPKNDFLSNICQLLGPNWSQNEKCSEFIKIWSN